MKLHLPKTLLVAVLAACVAPAYGDSYTALLDKVYTVSEGIPTHTTTSGMTHLVWHPGDDGIVITNANIEVAGQLWTGSGNAGGTGAVSTTTNTLVQFDGVISGSAKWKLNEFSSSTDSGIVVYKFTNSNSTFTGTFSMESGNANANANSQISLYNVGTALIGATVNFDAPQSGAKGILSIESSLSLGGLTGGSDNDRITSTSADNTLTLSVASGNSCTYAGTYGTGKYFSSAYTEGVDFAKAENNTAALNITKTGDGTQTLSGTGVLGTVAVQAGSLVLSGTSTVTSATVSGGSLELSGTSNGGSFTSSGTGTVKVGALTVNSNTTLSLSGTSTTMLDTITNNGVVNLSGALLLSGDEYDGYTILDGMDNTGDGIADSGASDGYIVGGGVKFNLVSGGTITYDNVTSVSYNGANFGKDALSFADGTLTVSATLEASGTMDYYVNGTVDYSTGSVIASDTTTGIVLNGGTLNLNTALNNNVTGADGNGILVKQNSVINIGDGVTLTASDISKDGGSLTLNGVSTAIYDAGSISSTTLDVTLGADWNGTVVITNSVIAGNTLNSFGNKIKLVGLSGWMQHTAATINSDLELENYSAEINGETVTKSAFVFDDNSASKTYSFRGKITGSGDFQIATKAGSDAPATIEFAGNTSDWAGGIVVTNAYLAGENATTKITVKLTGGEDIFSEEGNKGFVMNRTSTNNGDNIIDLKIGHSTKESTMHGAISMGENADARSTLNLAVTGNTTFKKGVEVTSLAVDTGKTAKFEEAVTTGAMTLSGTAQTQISGTGSISVGNVKVSGDGASIERNDNGTNAYAAANDSYNVNNASVEVAADKTNGTTISNRLQGVSLTNTGEGLLTTSNGFNNLTEVIAETGNINLTWFAEQAQQETVTNLTIGAGRTVGVYAGHAVDGVEKDITVSSLTAGSGATLNANLILTTGASLTLDGALAMGSTLTLGTALTLDDATRQAIMGLSAGEKHALFTGVDALTLNGATYTKGTVLGSTSGHDLGTYFVLADAGTPAVLSDTTAASGYYLGYTAEGTVYAGKVIPEPTTATLSLLALAALAARRRRK